MRAAPIILACAGGGVVGLLAVAIGIAFFDVSFDTNPHPSRPSAPAPAADLFNVETVDFQCAIGGKLVHLEITPPLPQGITAECTDKGVKISAPLVEPPNHEGAAMHAPDIAPAAPHKLGEPWPWEVPKDGQWHLPPRDPAP